MWCPSSSQRLAPYSVIANEMTTIRSQMDISLPGRFIPNTGPFAIFINWLLDSAVIITRPKTASYKLQVQSSDGVSSECKRKGMSSLLILDTEFIAYVSVRRLLIEGRKYQLGLCLREVARAGISGLAQSAARWQQLPAAGSLNINFQAASPVLVFLGCQLTIVGHWRLTHRQGVLRENSFGKGGSWQKWQLVPIQQPWPSRPRHEGAGARCQPTDREVKTDNIS
ncbi:hypothetical protein DV515_00002221 [Chloebia gouldiae]|uniref:Uncharacterized protein n=1 Tax=Chloebia gouldiae TaxID=44316 RepID=A0A3L8SWK1_CHLGU|nr:hypothetical protein DV515_00002221 [Chloebia gouldiae]